MDIEKNIAVGKCEVTPVESDYDGYWSWYWRLTPAGEWITRQSGTQDRAEIERNEFIERHKIK